MWGTKNGISLKSSGSYCAWSNFILSDYQLLKESELLKDGDLVLHSSGNVGYLSPSPETCIHDSQTNTPKSDHQKIL